MLGGRGGAVQTVGERELVKVQLFGFSCGTSEGRCSEPSPPLNTRETQPLTERVVTDVFCVWSRLPAALSGRQGRKERAVTDRTLGQSAVCSRQRVLRTGFPQVHFMELKIDTQLPKTCTRPVIRGGWEAVRVSDVSVVWWPHFAPRPEPVAFIRQCDFIRFLVSSGPRCSSEGIPMW